MANTLKHIRQSAAIFALILTWATVQHCLAAVSPVPRGKHDFHVTYSRLAVEGNIAVCNIRFFKDDLQEGLQAFSESPNFALDVSPDTDALFLNYLASRFVMKAGTEVLNAALVGSGEDYEGKEEIWWYTLQFEAEEVIDALNLTNTFLIEQFEDQKNIVKIQHFPSENTFSYYFDEEDTQFDIEL